MTAFPYLDRISDYPALFAAQTPDAEAMWFQGTAIRYVDFAREVDSVARAVAGLGLSPGARVGVLSTPRPEVLTALLGIIRAGYVYVGLNPRYTLHELDYVIGDSQPEIILSLAEFEELDFAPLIADLAAAHPCVRATFRLDEGLAVGGLRSRADFLAAGTAVSDTIFAEIIAGVEQRQPAVIVYTSGSSGRPKGAVIPHDALVYGPHRNATVINVEASRSICSMPFNHIGCVADVCATTLVSGGMLAFMDRLDIAGMLELIERLKITTLQHVPTVFYQIIKHPDFATRDLSSLRVAAWGGAAIPMPVLRKFREMSLDMLLTYGLTESVSNICFADHTSTDEQLTSTVGRPDPNQLVKLVDEEGNPVAPGQPGEIRAKHHAQMLGYFNRPDATAAAWDKEGYLCTGDVAVLQQDGTYRLVGRRSEFFKSGGYNVYPREIELCLEEHPAVGLAAVVEMPDPVFQEVGVAFVQTRANASPAEAADLSSWCRERLANYKIPKMFIVDEDLPFLPIGKVDKQQLRQRMRQNQPAG